MSQIINDLHTRCRALGRSRNTAKTYATWCVNYIHWLRRDNGGHWRHPKDCGDVEVTRWLTEMATRHNYSQTSQNCALQGVLFLYKWVIGRELGNIDAVRAKRPKNIPAVMSQQEVAAVLSKLAGQQQLVGQLLYGCGMRIGEAVALRVKDIDFGNRQITIHAGKGNKSRVVGLPSAVEDKLRQQIEIVRTWHSKDVADGCNRVELPYRYAAKSPMAAGQFGWYWLFCSHVRSRHPEAGWLGRYHVDQSNFGRSFRVAAKKAGILRRVTPHTLRHSFATYQVHAGVPLPTVQRLMGHSDISTTMVYTHIDPAGVTATQSPLDRLAAAA